MTGVQTVLFRSVAIMSESDNGRQSAPLSKETLDFCLSESLTASGLREIIERRDLASNDDDDLADYAFLYACAVCRNPKVNEDIIRLLLEYFPVTVRRRVGNVYPPLLHACANPNVTLNIIKLLIDTAPDTLRSVTNDGSTPLHWLCNNDKLDNAVATEILNLFIEKSPESVRHADNAGTLPIHLAVQAAKSPNFCRVLIETYPGSEQISASNGLLPLHCACLGGHVTTVQYLYKVYPDAINHAMTIGLADGIYPIHFAIGRDDPVAAFKPGITVGW